MVTAAVGHVLHGLARSGALVDGVQALDLLQPDVGADPHRNAGTARCRRHLPFAAGGDVAEQLFELLAGELALAVFGVDLGDRLGDRRL